MPIKSYLEDSVNPQHIDEIPEPVQEEIRRATKTAVNVWMTWVEANGSEAGQMLMCGIVTGLMAHHFPDRNWAYTDPGTFDTLYLEMLDAVNDAFANPDLMN